MTPEEPAHMIADTSKLLLLLPNEQQQQQQFLGWRLLLQFFSIRDIYSSCLPIALIDAL